MASKVTDLEQHLALIQLPDELDLAVLAAQTQPECTPEADVAALKLDQGERDVQALMGSVYNPADLAAIGALVRRHVPPQDVVVDGSAKLPAHSQAQRCVSGSLHVKGDMSLVALLVVCGDLRVDGLLRDCGPDSTLVVLGDLHVGALQTTGEIWVLGSLTAQRYVWGHYNDNTLEVTGVIRAPLVLSDDHGIEGQCEVQHGPPSDGDDEPGDSDAVHVFDLWNSAHRHALRLITPPEAWVENKDEGEDDVFDISVFEAHTAGT